MKSKADLQESIDKRLASGSSFRTIAECVVYDAIEMASMLMMKHDDLIDVKTGSDLIDLARLILEREEIERGR